MHFLLMTTQAMITPLPTISTAELVCGKATIDRLRTVGTATGELHGVNKYR